MTTAATKTEKTTKTWRSATGLQRAMILASLKPQAGGAYYQQLIVSLDRRTNQRFFLRAAQSCLERHAGLMARFDFREGQLFQTSLEHAEPPAPEVDLSRESGDREERLQKFLNADRLDPLLLMTDRPLWRSRLIQLGPEDVVWLWTHHHALCDGASYPPLLVQIFGAYDQLLETGCLPEGAASPDFSDYLDWLDAQDWSAEKEIWESRLKREDRPTPLPEIGGRRNATSIGSQGQSYRARVDIPVEVEQALRIYCAKSGLTLNTLLIAGCALWLARMHGEDSAVFGAMRAGRKSSIPDADLIIGPLVNTVPLRVVVSDDISLSAWLLKVREDWLELRTLEHCSLAQIAEWTGFGIAASDLPIVLNFQRARLTNQLRSSGLPPSRCEARLVQANDVPLMLNGYDTPRFEVDIIGHGGSVSEATVAAAAHGIGAALRAFATNQKQRIGAIELLTDEDRKILRHTTRGPKIDVPDGPAHELIERQIRRHPNAIAIEQGRRHVSYREFGEIAQRIADNIAEMGGAGQVVAVLLPPSIEILGIMLGSFRAGAAFLLINPELPREERAAMLRRPPVAMAITAPDVLKETQALVPRVFTFEQIASSKSRVNPSTAQPEIKPNDLAYLVHTSGSTGEKKFVEVEHHSLAQTLSAMVRLYGYDCLDRRLAMASPGNDYFIGEMLVALSGGATIVFPERGRAMAISDFLDQLRRERITVTGIPASYFHEWARSLDEDRAAELPPNLRLVICAMEKAIPQLVEKWRRVVGRRIRWLNVYGPAETTIAVTAWDPADAPSHDEVNVPIGRPFGNAEIYLLDQRRRRVPVGVCGEIAIAGPIVARGYRNNEEATRQKFVTNPFAISAEFARLYLSGDYGYLNERGEFVFLERRDRQIKIRGHRVELGEIEAILEEHEELRQAIVMLEGEQPAPRLVAYVVPTSSFDERSMVEWMKTRLPTYMRPMEFIVLDHIPLMPTGKVDRVALSKVYHSRPARQRTMDTDASTPEEAMLNSLWTKLLGDHCPIGRTDSFFDLGGNSLLAVRLLTDLKRDFGITLSIHDLFTYPTIEALARLISSKSRPCNFTSLVPLNSGGPGNPLFIVHGWGGGVFHYLDFAQRLNGVRAVFGLQAVDYAGDTPHESFEQMAQHYADEIARGAPSEPFDLMGNSLGGMIAYATACELARRGHTVGRLYLVDTTPFNLPRWVHVWHVVAQSWRRHLKAILRASPRSWPRYLKKARRSFKQRLQQWPAANNRARKPLPPDAEYYAVIGQEFVPQPAPFEVRLFTPNTSPSTETYWKYLTRGRVRNFALNSGHIDMLEREKLDHFMAAFEQASEQ